MNFLVSGAICPEWKAEWIWKNHEKQTNDFAYFRKEFYLGKTVEKARIYASAHNHMELYVNGRKVSGYVTPAPSHPEKSKLYLCYDITAIVKSGSNVFGASAHYLGGGGQNYIDGLPGFILQCHLKYTDHSEEVIVTDSAWKALGQTPFQNGAEFQQNRRISAIENFDASKEPVGWLESGFNDSQWEDALLSPINAEAWELRPQTIPEGGIHEIIIPGTAGLQVEGVQVFDAGKIITGWPRLEVTCAKGTRITLRYSEDIGENGRVKHNVCNEASENYYDAYTAKGEGREIWEPCFSFKAFRYVEVTGYPGILSPENIKIVSAGTEVSYTSFFNSSNQLLNNIYNACIQTQINNITGQMVDCPHREQAQYLADSDLQAETFSYGFMNPEILEKVLSDFRDAQLEDGRFPFVFPTNLSNPNFAVKIPEWDLHFITLLWKTYFIYNNTGILHACYETARKTVNYYLGIRSGKTGLVPKAAGFPEGWNISDWPYPDIDETGEFLTVQNCKLYHAMEVMERIASTLHLEEDTKEFGKNAGSLKESILKYLYRPDKKLFSDCYGSEQCHQGTQVIAFQYGLVPRDHREAVLDFIVGEGFGSSTLLSLNLLQVLFENGKEQAAYGLINRTDYPGWGHMIAKGFKTIWEGFQNIESHSHAWNAYPARILLEYITGIKAAAPGFGEIVIKPYMPSGMQFAEGKVTTVKGEIYAKWERDGNGMTMKVKIPEGTIAYIILPGSETMQVSVCDPHVHVIHIAGNQ